MLFWIFVIALGSALGVLLGGGTLLWLRDQGMNIFEVVWGLFVWIVILAMLAAIAYGGYWAWTHRRVPAAVGQQ
jgi:hypothetical protein